MRRTPARKPAPSCGLPALTGRLVLALALGVTATPSWGAAGHHPTDDQRHERGFPLVHAIEPVGAEVLAQNFGVASCPDGLLVVGNLGGVLTFDGARWQVYPIGNGRSVFSIACDAAGHIAVGGVDEIGLMEPDALGELQYRSLVAELPPELRNFGQVNYVAAVPGGFAFVSPRWLARWHGAPPPSDPPTGAHPTGDHLSVIERYDGAPPFSHPFAVGQDLYVWNRVGLYRLQGDELVLAPGGEAFRGRRIDAVEQLAGGLLISLRGDGVYRLEGGALSSLPSEVSAWAKRNRVLTSIRLPDGRIVLGSVLGGLALLSPTGELERLIDTRSGLPDDLVYSLAVDHEGALWAGLNLGLARIEVGSAISLLDRRTGLQGSVYTVERHAGQLWVGTAAGLFAERATVQGAEAAAAGRVSISFDAVPGILPSAWSLLSVDDDLLVGSAGGLVVVRQGRATTLAGTESLVVYSLTRSRHQPARVWLGTDDGLGAIRHDAAGWHFEGLVAGSPREVRQIIETSGGRLWLSSSLDEATGLLAPEPGQPADAIHRLAVQEPDEWAFCALQGRVFGVAKYHLGWLDEDTGVVVDEPQLHPLLGGNRVVEDAAGNLWTNSRPPRVLRRAAQGFEREARVLYELGHRDIETIFAEPDGAVWLASGVGLYRFTSAEGVATPPLRPPLLSRVSVAGKPLFFGSGLGELPVSQLAAGPRRLRIELAPLSSRPGLQYQTRLDPLDEDWGPPSIDPFVELTQVPAGRFTFRARLIGPSSEAGPETAWTFRVLPRWYQTPWAFALASGLALAGVRAYGRMRSRALAVRARDLEERVAAQTLELQQKVEQLGRAHSELARANERLEALSLQDELTGIANRRRLQQVLVAEWARASRQGSSIAFILLDLDHFKQLNDSRGHLEGDLCLQAVARFLAHKVQRAGDVVARYGGEEFCILLPATTLEQACSLAEQLREGIEELALSHPDGGVITASLGVASWVPQPGQEPEDLVEAADTALYRAKTEGRNRVRTA